MEHPESAPRCWLEVGAVAVLAAGLIAASVTDDLAAGAVHAGMGAVCCALLLAASARVRAGTTRLDQLTRTNHRLSLLLQNPAEATIVCDRQGRVIFATPGAGHLLGWSPRAADADPRTPLPGALADLVQAAIGEPAHDATSTVEMPASDRGPARDLAVTVRNHLLDPDLAVAILTLRDLTDQRQYERHIAHLALHDHLTGLPNRTLLIDRLRAALARRGPSSGLAVLFLGVDNFKLINESLGHHVGDQVLVAVGERIRETVRAQDVVARFGGDEFVVLCTGLDIGEVAAVCDRLLAGIRQPFAVRGLHKTLTATIGIAFTRNGARAEELLRDADAAMARAKGQGGNRHHLFDDSIHDRAVARLELDVALHRAVERQEFEVHYQPITRTEGEQHRHELEALVRWRHPRRGLLSPAEFLDLAEEIGVSADIGAYVLDESCRQVREWIDAGAATDLSVGVNLSARQFRDPGLVDAVATTLARHRLGGANLTLELTETVVMDGCDDGDVGILRALKGLGVRLAIDDFGTGYSSLARLMQLPIDVVKIDRSFIRHVDSEPSRSIVRSIIDACHALSLVVVAEGIEEQAQLDTVAALGCDLVQGYLVGRPTPAADAGPSIVAAQVAPVAAVVPLDRHAARAASS